MNILWNIGRSNKTDNLVEHSYTACWFLIQTRGTSFICFKSSFLKIIVYLKMEMAFIAPYIDRTMCFAVLGLEITSQEVSGVEHVSHR